MSDFSFKIALSGPSRVGKTSLVTTILAQAQSLLAGTPVSLTPADKPTEGRIADNKDQLRACLHAKNGIFDAASLAGTDTKTLYRLAMSVGKSNIKFELLDFPGGWLHPRTRPDSIDAEWAFCQQWMSESPVLFVPIESTLVMEAMTTQKETVKAVKELQISQVEDLARAWASKRAEIKEPGLVIFAPVKCESYFPDNAGYQNKSEILFERALSANLYGAVRNAIEEEMDSCLELLGVEYHPVGTLGCVDFCTGRFVEDHFQASYEKRKNAEWAPYGADGVLFSLAKFAALGEDRADRGLLSNFWRFLTGEQRELKSAMQMLANRDYPKHARIIRDLDSS